MRFDQIASTGISGDAGDDGRDSRLRTREGFTTMAKKAAPKAAAPKVVVDKSVKTKAATKAEIYTALADKTKLTKKQVASVFDAYVEWTKKQLAKKGPGAALLPGLGKIKAVYKPATKETLKDNPFKPGEKMVVKAKPSRTNVKIVALKAYKEAL